MSDLSFAETDRNSVKRLAKRGSFDKATIYQILDSTFLCHVAFVSGEQPFVIPTIFARVDDAVYIHGSHISRMLKHIETGAKICVCVTLVDGLVLARSAFHHSINYRSAVLFGTGKLVAGNERLMALESISENILAGRWKDARKPNEKELNVTSVIRIDIEDASAKIREGGPIDDESDYDLPIWAGILPVSQIFGTPVSDDRLPDTIVPPTYLFNHDGN